MDKSLIYFGFITAAGTAILTVTSVWKLLMAPLQAAITKIQESVLRLEARIDAGDAKRESDVKDLWKFLAEREADK